MDLKNKKSFFLLSFSIMVFFLVSQTALAYQITGNSIETNNASISAGTTPDSFLYFLDVALDKINLALTFSPTEKAKKGLDIARERLMEIKKMMDEGKIEDSKIAQQKYLDALEVVQSSVKKIKRDNSTEEMKDQIEIEKDLEEHKTEIEEVMGELKVKIKIKGNISLKRQELRDSILESLKNKTGEVEIEIENEKEKTKTRMKQESDKNEKELEDEIGSLEEKSGLKEIRKEKAWEKIRDVEEEINRTKRRINSSVTRKGIFLSLKILDRAKESYFVRDYKKSLRFSSIAERQIENYKKQFEKETESEKEIEVEIGNNKSRIRIDISGVKTRFILDSSDKEKIISEIVRRTGLSVSEVKNILKIKKEKPNQEVEIEVEAENGITKVKVKINGTEKRFTLDTADRKKIMLEIMSRTGLTKNQIEKNSEFRIKERENSKNEGRGLNKDEKKEKESNRKKEGINKMRENEEKKKTKKGIQEKD